MRIEFQPAFVLHTRPYRDTSLLVDIFTPEYGRVSMVARGVRQRKSNKRNLLNPFTPLLISFQGKSDLKLLTAVELDSHAYTLVGAQVYCGFYLNELLMRLLPEMDAHPQIFNLYKQILFSLQAGVELEPALRRFEFGLLNELGYGINFETEVTSGEAINAEQCYWFDPQEGFLLLPEDVSNNNNIVASSVRKKQAILSFSGADILAMKAQDFSSPTVRQAAKGLSRIMMQPLLGNRPLKSRELFASLHKVGPADKK